jgi:pheromone shutdown protein TraB
VHIIGTCHISNESAIEIREIIQEKKPDTVVLEVEFFSHLLCLFLVMPSAYINIDDV